MSKLKAIGWFKETGGNSDSGLSIRDFIGKIDPEVKWRVVNYLKSCPVIATSPTIVFDQLSEEKTVVGGLVSHTDGKWFWPSDFIYYVEKYGVSVPGEFLSHLNENLFIVPKISNEELIEISDSILETGI